MSLRLDGTNPLASIGVTPTSLASDYTFKRNPTTKDYQGFNLMDRWLNYVNQTLWVLVSKVANVATWQQTTGVVRTLTSNSGGAVGPNTAGNINVVGDGVTITGVGNPGTNTITLSAVATGTIETLTGNSGGAVSPTAGNINVVGTGVITVVGNPGTSTLTITPSGAISSSFPTDAGTATPSAGVLNVLGGTAGRDINTSGSGNTIHVDLKNAITLGDLSTIAAGSDALTLATGDMEFLASNLSAVTNQMIKFSGNNRISFFNNAVFVGALAGNTTGSGLFNIGIGPSALAIFTTGVSNVAIGNGTLQLCTTGGNNTAVGYLVLSALNTGTGNAGYGDGAMTNLTTGIDNTAIGSDSLNAVVSGNYNVALGDSAGIGLTTNDSSNICIGTLTAGSPGDNHTLRVGAGAGTGNGQLNRAFINGIRGITTGNNDAVAVLIDSAGQLGTVSSTRRLKDNIQDMGMDSSAIMQLRPVTFEFKQDVNRNKQYGLIAEEVEEIFPRLVVKDDGQPTSVKYHELPALLLNELQKQNMRISELEDIIRKGNYVN